MYTVPIIHELLVALAAITFGAWIAIALLVTFGNRKIADLRQVSTEQDATLPQVSIIVSARDEEAGVQRAILSMLKQEYPDYELIAVDDRSTVVLGIAPPVGSSTTPSMVPVKDCPKSSSPHNAAHSRRAEDRAVNGYLRALFDAEFVSQWYTMKPLGPGTRNW